MATAPDVEEVEFRVAKLLVLDEYGKPRNLSFALIENLFDEYIKRLTSGSKELKRFFVHAGRYPVKFLFLSHVEETVIPGHKGYRGKIGFVQESHYPIVISKLTGKERPLPLSPTDALFDLAHFIVFEHKGSAYVIYEMNRDAPSLTRFAEYLFHVAKKLNLPEARGLKGFKFEYVMIDPRRTLARYRFVTGITISGEVRAAEHITSLSGVDILRALLSRNAKRFTIELSGGGDPIGITIHELLEFLERIDLSRFSRFIVKVKESRFRSEVAINLLSNVLYFTRKVPLAREGNRVLRNIDSHEAYKILVDLVPVAVEAIEAAATPGPRRPLHRSLLEYIPRG